MKIDVAYSGCTVLEYGRKTLYGPALIGSTIVARAALGAGEGDARRQQLQEFNIIHETIQLTMRIYSKRRGLARPELSRIGPPTRR